MLSLIKNQIFKTFNGNRETSPEIIEFHDQFIIASNSLNGITINGIYIPEEVILNIFMYLNPRDILNCSLVCKRWCNLAKSNVLWQTIYNHIEYPKKANNLPWYVFYCYFTTDGFKNLIQNGNGEKQFEHWTVVSNGGDKFLVENIPCGCSPLPVDIPECHGYSSCFATSYQLCCKYQKCDISNKRLLSYIVKKYKPTIYISEWFCGRFDCACIYKLWVTCDTKDYSVKDTFDTIINGWRLSDSSGFQWSKYQLAQISQWFNPQWEKMELLWTDYPDDITSLYFCHEGKDTQFWAGHYGSKFAGGVMKFLFDSIKPLPEDYPDFEEVDGI